MESYLPLAILLLPLIGFIINGVVLPWYYKGFAKTPAHIAGSVATLMIGSSFILASVVFLEIKESHQAVFINAFDWFNFGGLSIPFELHIDQLSGLLLLIITGVGTLIHLYSISYMHDEECVGRYFSYLNLFCFA